MTGSSDASCLLVSEGTRLVHIGPHKTGTTALQGALFAARPELLRQGVRHVGRSRHPAAAVHAVLGQRSQFAAGSVPPMRRWFDLVHEVERAAEPRTVLSSEFFSDAHPDQVRRIVANLGGSRVHVVVTLRPLATILRSQWQQLVQDGMSVGLDAWLRAVLDRPASRHASRFWLRHRHDALVARWAEAVGSDHVTAVVADDADHDLTVRAFERLLGLHEGTLVAQPSLTNRSMMLAEVEVIRAFNKAFRASGLPRPLLSRTMHFGAARYMKRLPADAADRPIELPQEVLERVAVEADHIATGIGASGIRVVGDLDRLRIVPASGPESSTTHLVVPPSVAAAMATGVLVSAGLARGRSDPTAGQGPDQAQAVANVPTYAIAGTIVGRLWSLAVGPASPAARMRLWLSQVRSRQG